MIGLTLMTLLGITNNNGNKTETECEMKGQVNVIDSLCVLYWYFDISCG